MTHIFRLSNTHRQGIFSLPELKYTIPGNGKQQIKHQFLLKIMYETNLLAHYKEN